MLFMAACCACSDCCNNWIAWRYPGHRSSAALQLAMAAVKFCLRYSAAALLVSRIAISWV